MKNTLGVSFLSIGVFFVSSLSFAGQATDYCKSLGGTVEVSRIGDSNAKMCKLGKAGIGLKTLYNHKHRPENADSGILAVQAFLKHEPYKMKRVMIVPVVKEMTPSGPIFEFVERPIQPGIHGGEPGLQAVANAQSTYCRQLGGKVAKMELAGGSIGKACIFSDFSAIEALTLYRGPEAEENKELTPHLK